MLPVYVIVSASNLAIKYSNSINAACLATKRLIYCDADGESARVRLRLHKLQKVLSNYRTINSILLLKFVEMIIQILLNTAFLHYLTYYILTG